VQPGAGYAEVTTPNGYRISLNAESVSAGIHGSFQAPPAHASQRMELAFRCDTPAEVDEMVGRLQAAGHGVVKAPWDAFWGQRYAIVADPDGTHISIFAPL
jgi:uncharacterized glyoxalase superfamily protein PhnB